VTEEAELIAEGKVVYAMKKEMIFDCFAVICMSLQLGNVQKHVKWRNRFFKFYIRARSLQENNAPHKKSIRNLESI
jgi:hypothetical protein